MKKSFLILLFVACAGIINAQGTSGTSAKFEYRKLVDMPTAGILSKGFAGISVDVLPYGVVISKIEVGVFDGFSFGISYGGTNVIGSGVIDWYKLPGINVRARVLNETEALPAFSLGFDSQGKGVYDKNLDRFQIKSPGFYLAASKNFELLGYFSLHALVNYSLEREDGDKDLNLGVGFEKTIGEKVSLVGEFDMGLNDNTGSAIGKGNGYFNLGLRWSVGDGLTLGFDLRDLLQNKRINANSADRGFFVEYLKALF